MKNKVGRPSGSREIASKIRFGFTKAIEQIEGVSGRTLADLIQREIEEHGVVHVARALSPYSPKELDVTQTIIQPEDWLELMADESDAGSKRESTTAEDSVQGFVH